MIGRRWPGADRRPIEKTGHYPVASPSSKQQKDEDHRLTNDFAP